MARSIRGFVGGLFFSWMVWLNFFSDRGVNPNWIITMIGIVVITALVVFWDEWRAYRKFMFGVDW